MEPAAIHARSLKAQYAACRPCPQMGGTQRHHPGAVRPRVDAFAQGVIARYPARPIPTIWMIFSVRQPFVSLPNEMEEFDKEYAAIDLMGHRADPFTESQIDKQRV